MTVPIDLSICLCIEIYSKRYVSQVVDRCVPVERERESCRGIYIGVLVYRHLHSYLAFEMLSPVPGLQRGLILHRVHLSVTTSSLSICTHLLSSPGCSSWLISLSSLSVFNLSLSYLSIYLCLFILL